jgi:hypothetical protein
MWRRLMRRTFAPGRPPLFMEQWALALVTAVALAAGIAVALGVLR